MNNLNCDVLIVGAGVAGLCAAIAAARNKLDTILIEKESEIGYKIKGECIEKKSPIFEKIFGKGLPKDVILNELTGRRIYSPSAKKFMEMEHSELMVAIDYRLFMIEIFKELSKTNCRVFLNTKFLNIIEENKKVVGATCIKDNEEFDIKAKFIIAADGNESKIGNELNIIQPEIYYSLKFNYENLTVPNPNNIELHLITDPPGAMWIFPKGPSSGETGITVWTHELPDNFDILELWRKKSMENDRMRGIIKEAKSYYISRDFLNFGGPIKNIFGNGVAFVGDAGGHVGAIGASGIISCMSTGFDVAEFVANALLTEGEITEGMVEEFKRKYKKSQIQKYLKKEQSAGKMLRNVLFKSFKTEEIIDENWEKLETMVVSQSGDF
ncbi:MAG: NAD(P)/FAD-dependent oxidoreductase [Candidatus Helarchaeota archaeon]|nr:NAD(P)/FAD-dependent oxidoreductase [Candidatus Helarchaeota archaeon]